MKPENLLLIGATGSIGVNALRIVEQHRERFRIVALSTHQQVEPLLRLAAVHKPEAVAITGCVPSAEQTQAFKRLGVTVLQGGDALTAMAATLDYDLFVNAVVGAVGFLPTLAAVKRGVRIALANKEALVIGGSLVTAAARDSGAAILPIDSEHSAIFQCLFGENPETVEEIILTGSGGPFRSFSHEEMKQVTVAQALRHPNWSMGAKITIDSATMMNKGLEIIEAHWLFDMPPEKIRVVIHPQSIVHSMVAFRDGSVKAQWGVPDMRVPIQLAMTWPQRCASDFPRLDFYALQNLTFFAPEPDKFPALGLACAALRSGGTAPAVLNAANEAAVHHFLAGRIGYLDIANAIDNALQRHVPVAHPDAETLLAADRWARQFVEENS